MADVQLEHGYTRIANETLEQVARLPLNGTQFRILVVLWRETYGFNRKECELSESLIAAKTGIFQRQVRREVKALISMGIIAVVRDATFTTPRAISFNKDFDRWSKSPQGTNTPPPVGLDPSPPVGLDPSPPVGLDPHVNTPLNTPLNTSSSPPSGGDGKHKIFEHDSAAYRLAENLRDRILFNNPQHKPLTETDLQKWALDFDRMIRLDHRTPKDIDTVMYWAQEDSFWRCNILSAAKLRKQYDRLTLKMGRGRADCGNAQLTG